MRDARLEGVESGAGFDTSSFVKKNVGGLSFSSIVAHNKTCNNGGSLSKHKHTRDRVESYRGGDTFIPLHVMPLALIDARIKNA